MTREEGCEWYQSNHYYFAYNRWCFLDTLKGLVSRCKSPKTGFSVYCKKHVASVLMGLTLPKVSAQIIHPSPVVALWVDLYASCRHLIKLTVGVLLLGGGGRWLYEQKLFKYRTLVAVSAIWAQLLRRQVAYGYMGCSAMCHLDTIFLVAWAPSKQTPHFLCTKRLKSVFCNLHREISPLSVPKRHRRIVCEVPVRFTPLKPPPSLSFYNTFNIAISTPTPFSVASLSERYCSNLLKRFGCWQNISSNSIKTN